MVFKDGMFYTVFLMNWRNVIRCDSMIFFKCLFFERGKIGRKILLNNFLGWRVKILEKYDFIIYRI